MKGKTFPAIAITVIILGWSGCGSTAAYANFDFPPWGDPHFGDPHYNRGHIDGEIGEGGPGSSYILIRFAASSLGAFLPKGNTVKVGGWSEAESNLYHHFAFDPLTPGTWLIQTN